MATSPEPVKIKQQWYRRLEPGAKALGLPLSTVLVILVVVLSGIGLLGASLAVQRSVQSATYGMIDAELRQEVENSDSNFALLSGLGQLAEWNLKPNTYYAWYDRNFPYGREVKGGYGNSIPDVNELEVNGGPVNVDAKEGADRDVKWRAMAQETPEHLVVVAKDITRETAILNRLALGQLTIGLVVLAMIALLSSYFIRRALQPLRTVEETANAIAHGDLERRVPEDWPSNTEVGSLAESVNSMLEQIQSNITQLKDKEEEMRRFVGDASHELRTPLTSVKGFAELYRCGATNDANLVIEKIEGEASRMSLLVEDLLALTRAEGKQVERAPVDLLELITSVTSSLHAAFPDRSIALQPETIDLPVVSGNAPKLHQVFTNLVVNALKHAGPEANVKVRITEETKDLKPQKFIVEVIDDGVGISEKDAANVFERFYRADTSRTRATGGSGLGLAIVKSLVESHDGTVTVHSKLGEGTTFRVELPALEDDVVPTVESAKP